MNARLEVEVVGTQYLLPQTFIGTQWWDTICVFWTQYVFFGGTQYVFSGGT